MNILHLDTERTWRGGEQQMCYLALGLEQRGHIAHLVCRPGSECESRAKELGLTVHPIRIRGDIDVRAARRIARLIDGLGIDIAHAHTARAHLPVVWAKSLSKRPLATVVHRRVDFSIHKLPFGLSGLKYRSGVDRFIAVTAAVKRQMIKDGIKADLIDVIHSGADLSRFAGSECTPGLREELGIPEGARVIGNVGFLVGHKDHANLLHAATKVLKRFPEAFFVVIGEGELRGELEALARSLGILDSVSLPGFRRDVPACLKEFEVFCLSSWGEGIGGVVLEAMASRLPVVSTRAGGLDEVVRDGENGLLVPVRDSDALAAALCRMLSDHDASQRMAVAGHETVKQDFSVDRMVERTITVYERILGAFGRRSCIY